MKSHNWKFNYLSTLEKEIDKIKEEGHYRVFNNIERKAGQYPKVYQMSCNFNVIHTDPLGFDGDGQRLSNMFSF